MGCESLKKLKSAKKLSSIFGNEIALSARLAAGVGRKRKTDLLKSATDLLIKVIAKEAF